MKKAVLLFVLLSLLLTGCCLKHDWMEATCTDPKSCRKCDETEGEALGHDWQDADCVNPQICRTCGDLGEKALGHNWQDATCENPKTCDRCSETEGEALEHTYGAWALSGKDEMARTCSVCNSEERSAADRELIGIQFLTGSWYSNAMLDYDVGEWEFFNEPLFTVEFRADGTGTLTLTSPQEGTLVFESYDAKDDEYSFNFVTADGSSYGFDYDAPSGNLFTFGSGLALAWEKD